MTPNQPGAMEREHCIKNRPCVAGAVLQTPSSFINWLYQSLSDSFPPNLQNILTPGILRQFSPPPVCHLSHVICHRSHVACHVSHVMVGLGWSSSVEGLLSTGLPGLFSNMFSSLNHWSLDRFGELQHLTPQYNSFNKCCTVIYAIQCSACNVFLKL